MINLIKNELLKLHYRRKFIVTLIILISLSLLICLGMYGINKFVRPEAQISALESSVNELKNRKNSSNISDSEKKSLDQQITQLELEINKLKLEKSTSKEDNWQDQLKTNLSSLEQQLTNIDSIMDENSKEEIYKSYITTKYLIDNNIKPATGASLNAYIGIQGLIQALGAIFLVIIVAIISSDIVSGEYTPPTMKVLLTKPTSRSKVLLSKFIAACISSVLVIIIVELLLFIIMGILWGFGNLSSPVIVGTKYKLGLIKAPVFTKNIVPVFKSSYVIPVWSFLLKMLAFQTLFILSTVSFCFLLSTILKSSMISMTLSILGTIALSIFTQIPYFSKVSPFIFNSYSNPMNVIDGSVARSYGSPLMTPLIGTIVLILWGVICYAIAHITFNKKDMLV